MIRLLLRGVGWLVVIVGLLLVLYLLVTIAATFGSV